MLVWNHDAETARGNPSLCVSFTSRCCCATTRQNQSCRRRSVCPSPPVCIEQLGRCGLSQITPHSIILSDVANESAAVNRSNDLDSEFLRPSLHSCLHVCRPISLAIKNMFRVNLLKRESWINESSLSCRADAALGSRNEYVCANAGVAVQFNKATCRVDVMHNVCRGCCVGGVRVVCSVNVKNTRTRLKVSLHLDCYESWELHDPLTHQYLCISSSHHSKV